jgi:hypothetical protein
MKRGFLNSKKKRTVDKPLYDNNGASASSAATAPPTQQSPPSGDRATQAAVSCAVFLFIYTAPNR